MEKLGQDCLTKIIFDRLLRRISKDNWLKNLVNHFIKKIINPKKSRKKSQNYFFLVPENGPTLAKRIQTFRNHLVYFQNLQIHIHF